MKTGNGLENLLVYEHGKNNAHNAVARAAKKHIFVLDMCYDLIQVRELTSLIMGFLERLIFTRYRRNAFPFIESERPYLCSQGPSTGPSSELDDCPFCTHSLCIRFSLVPSHHEVILPSSQFPSHFPSKLWYALFISPIHSAFPACPVILDLLSQSCFCRIKDT